MGIFFFILEDFSHPGGGGGVPLAFHLNQFISYLGLHLDTFYIMFLALVVSSRLVL
jgi:hypothetical protein